MIDWFSVFSNSLWVMALAVALANISYASWQASIRKTRLRALLPLPGYQAVFNSAGLLFCIGLALTSLRTWQWILWTILAVLFLLQLFQAVRLFRSQH